MSNRGRHRTVPWREARCGTPISQRPREEGMLPRWAYIFHVFHESVIAQAVEFLASPRGLEQPFWGPIMRELRTFPFCAAAGVALLTNVNASAETAVAITYVPNSLAEATMAGGPWTLHQKAGKNPHDASGILPPSNVSTPFNPPTTTYGTPYKNYCVDGRVQSAQHINSMHPHYFPFVRKSENYGGGFSDHGPRIEQEATPSWSKHAEYLEGFFDYRPRNEQEATVVAIS